MQFITILGATGSIGLSTLDVMSRHLSQYSLFAVTGNTNVDGMVKICQAFSPTYAVMANEKAAQALQDELNKLGLSTSVKSGEQGLVDVASDDRVDIVMAAIVGGAGLVPTMAAAKSGKRICLANKEALVMSGQLFLDAVRENNAELLPVDSEHNAIFQSLPLEVQQGGELKASGVEQILLTGSGGPFLNRPMDQFDCITPELAVAHPNWSMGAKISVDSATMMNKGLEFVEARLLFNASFEQIKVVVHPQSIIHSMVSYTDGSVLAQMGQPDMRTPIAHSLAYPNRIASGVEPLDFTKLASFTFCDPDFERFPNLRLALEASKLGQGATTVLNASNEIAVEAFLQQQVSFTDIGKLNEWCLEQLGNKKPESIDDILLLDNQTRQLALEKIAKGITA
ncbi:1-deoxy-D-xylulose-5-phosphate reductoisomerase [Psychrosphaera sp.]|nr:1-deoxy-D-xylulose-5-phosphate reductoisomerase [Psychrosphaera sp.]